MKIVCDDKIPFLRGALEPYAQVVYAPGQAITASTVHDADALIVRTRTKCNAQLLEGSGVKMVATATIGFDHIDTDWCESHEIDWTNAPGCNSSSVEQYMGSLLVTMARSMGFECRNKTLGVIGVGNVGRKVARLAALLGFRVLVCDPPRARIEGESLFCTLEQIIEKADIITCHVPLIMEGEDSTYHLFDSKRIQAMRPDQILINTSRGEVVDCKALKEALSHGKLMAAALDVWENEPQIDRELLDMLFVATPHIAGYSADGKACGTAMSVQAIACRFELPCTDWAVQDIPAPEQNLEFSIDAAGLTPRQVLEEAILYSYNIKSDDARLRENPDGFELQRSDYPVRREFTAFSVKLLNDESGRSTVYLREAGFNIAE